MNRRTVLLGLGSIAGISIGSYLYQRYNRPAHPALTALLKAQLRYPEGTIYDTTPLYGAPLLINVWAPWCAPCVEELPELSNLFNDIKHSDNVHLLSNDIKTINFIAIGLDEPEKIAAFSRKVPTSFPLLEANTAPIDFIKQLGNRSGVLPFTVLFDKNGQIVQQKIGKIKSIELLEWFKLL
jgi:thiol-disulfide isomerase/thioredoxin